MTLKEAEEIEYILKSIKTFKGLPDRIIKLHKEGKHDEVVRIGCEISSELCRHFEEKLNGFPSLYEKQP